MTVTPDQMDDMDCRPLMEGEVTNPFLKKLLADHLAAVEATSKAGHTDTTGRHPKPKKPSAAGPMKPSRIIKGSGGDGKQPTKERASLSKAHIPTYIKRDGTVVVAHEDRRPGKGIVNPARLTAREDVQGNTEVVRDLFPAGEGYFHIVTITDGDRHTILDGHNRAVVASERGDDLPFVSLSRHTYDALKEMGFDDMEISHAALSHAGEYDAASGLDQKFPGARIAERGSLAVDKMLDLAGYEP